MVDVRQPANSFAITSGCASSVYKGGSYERTADQSSRPPDLGGRRSPRGARKGALGSSNPRAANCGKWRRLHRCCGKWRSPQAGAESGTVPEWATTPLRHFPSGESFVGSKRYVNFSVLKLTKPGISSGFFLRRPDSFADRGGGAASPTQCNSCALRSMRNRRPRPE